MTIPPTIQYSQIIFEHPAFGKRRREKYNGIEELANNIEELGLQVPLILSMLDDGRYLLEDGGRRSKALEYLHEEIDPITFESSIKDFTLYHGATCQPGCPGFILKGEAPTRRSFWLTELNANLHREDFTWQEKLGLVVDAYRELTFEAAKKSEFITMSQVGTILGVGYSEIQAAVTVYDAVRAMPELFKDCTSVLTAYKELLRFRSKQAEMELAKKLRAVKPAAPPVVAEGQPKQEEGEPAVELTENDISSVSVDFSGHFWQANSIDWLETKPVVFDHIICDPDFAISVDRLESNSASAGDGVIQKDIAESLSDLRRLIRAAFNCCRGFFVFFYDLDHHEKLQSWCEAAGWTVQRWPLIWNKIGVCSNAAASCNFPKNIEYAMVCHKPGAVLAKTPTTSVISCPPGNIVKENGHPFAKPYPVWNFIYEHVCLPGQHVFDPFLGSASSVPAALDLGLVPWGCELDPQHFASATINIHKKYSEMYKGKKVVFE